MSDYGLIGTLWVSKHEKKTRVVQIQGFVSLDKEYVVTKTISIDGAAPKRVRNTMQPRINFRAGFSPV